MTQKPRYVAAKQGVVHVKAKLEMANKAHSNAQRAAEAHESNVATMKQQLKYDIMMSNHSDFCLSKFALSLTDYSFLEMLSKKSKNAKRSLLPSRKNWKCN